MAVSNFSPVFPLVVLRIEGVDVVVALPIPHFLQQTNRAPLVPSAKFILDLATQLHNARIDLIKNSKLPQHLRPMSQLLHHRMTRRGTLIYTSATHHMTSDLGNLNLQTYDYTGQDQVIVSNGKGSNIHHVGSFYFFSSSKSLFLKNIHHVPRIKKNLILVYQFTKDNNVYFEFFPSFFCIKDWSSGSLLLKGKSINGLYPLQQLSKFSEYSPAALLHVQAYIDQCHNRFGHLSLRVIQNILSQHHLVVPSSNSNNVCHSCQPGKNHKLPFHLSDSTSEGPLDLLFTDVQGMSPQLSNHGVGYEWGIHSPCAKWHWFLFPQDPIWI